MLTKHRKRNCTKKDVSIRYERVVVSILNGFGISRVETLTAGFHEGGTVASGTESGVARVLT